MTQNSLLLKFAIEILIFYCIVYSLIKVDRVVKNKLMIVKDLSSDIPELLSQLNYWLKTFNINFEKNFKVAPLNPHELGLIAGNLFTEIIKFKLNPLPKSKIIFLIKIGYKIWSHRNKILATILNKKISTF